VAFANINHFATKSYNFCPCLSKHFIISSSKLIVQIPSISNALPRFGVLEQLNASNKGGLVEAVSLALFLQHFNDNSVQLIEFVNFRIDNTG
jgi:hypothetical protein